MLLAEPQRTPYDLHFQMFGFDVRVSPFFWLAAALLGWQLTLGIDTALARFESNPGQGGLLLIWIASVFVSILIHELGHAFAMRYYGIHAYIVLYHFGGLAVPDSASGFTGMSRRGGSTQQIVISAAGPAAQLALAALIIAALKATGSSLLFEIPYLEAIVPLESGEPIASIPLMSLLYFLILPSIFWALLNLLPVYPLDGGQISREVLTIFSPRDGLRNSLILSIVAGAAVAIYGLTHDDMMLGMMFGMLAFSSYQILQAYSGRGGSGPW
ncbi:MAG: site-2 protease family protein [Planctomycetota bacterium]